MNLPLWPDSVDQILGGDQAVVLATVTPANGVVLTPVTNFAVRDVAAGTLTVNSSVGAWKKLERIRRNPCLALAFHTRLHSLTDRPEYVLVQGRASVSAPIENYPATIEENWKRFAGPLERGPVWRRWLRQYHTRVEIRVAVERVIVWPDLSCGGVPESHGKPLPADPAPTQAPPGGGTAARIDHIDAARKVAALPEVLLGWAGPDGFPMVVPVRAAGSDADWMLLEPPAGAVPSGARRAGLTAHAFTRHVTGQNQRLHTGWLEADSAQSQVRYSPHTVFKYRMPSSKLIYRLAVGAATRIGHRRAQRQEVQL